MADLTQQQRRMELHRMLSRRSRVVASQLAKQWCCDERTVRRDLQAMRDVDHVPLEYDPLDQTWLYLGEVIQIHPILVSEEDRRALLFSLQATSQLDGTPVRGQIQRLYEALLATLPPEPAARFQRMMKSVRFTGPRTPHIKKEVWDSLLLCMEARKTVRVTYTDGYYGSTTQRELDPYGLIMRDRRWILVAYCHRRRGVLTFSLHRLADAQGTGTSFNMPKSFMDNYLADAFDGMQSTGTKVKVVLRIRNDAPKFVQDRQWSERESRLRDAQGRVVVRFQTAALFAVEREVRAEEGWVEILEPVESRERLRMAGIAIAKAHRPAR